MITVPSVAERLGDDILVLEKLSDDTLGPIEVIRWVNSALNRLNRGPVEEGDGSLGEKQESFGLELNMTIEGARKQIAAVYAEQYLIPELKRSYDTAKKDLDDLKGACDQWIAELKDPALSQERVSGISKAIRYNEEIEAMVGGQLIRAAGPVLALSSVEGPVPGGVLRPSKPVVTPSPVEGQRTSLLAVCQTASAKIQEKIAALDATMAQHRLDVTVQ